MTPVAAPTGPQLRPDEPIVVHFGPRLRSCVSAETVAERTPGLTAEDVLRAVEALVDQGIFTPLPDGSFLADYHGRGGWQ